MGAFSSVISGFESQANTALANGLQSLAQTGVGSANSGPAAIATGAQGAGQNGNPSGSIFDLSPSRIAAFVIGVILIGGGILMFKTTGVIISGTAKGAAALGAL